MKLVVPFLAWLPPAALFAVLVAVGPALALSSAAAAPGAGPFLVLTPPWRNGHAVIDAAGGVAVGPSQAPLTILAGGGPGFRAALLAKGAWAVIPARSLPFLCGES